MARTTVGIKIGSTSLKFAELAHSKGKHKLLNLGIEHLAYSEKEGRYPGYTGLLAQKLQDVVRTNNLNPRRIVTGIQGELVAVRIIRVPYMKDSELRDAVRWEAEEHLPYPVEDLSLIHI